MSIIGDTPEEHRRHIPHDAFLGDWLLGPECAQVMREAGTHVRDMYRVVVAKRSGALAASARVSLALGGTKNDRIVADVIVGEGTPRGGYGAAHEYGIGIHPRSRVPEPGWKKANDLIRVLAIVNSMQ